MKKFENVRKLLTKKRLPISIRFSLRPGYTTVQIRITVDGKEGSPFSGLPNGTVLYATGVNWNQFLQRSSGRNELDRNFNLEIDSIRTAINAVYDRQVSANLNPTPKSIQQEFQNGQNPDNAIIVIAEDHKWSAVCCYKAYLKELMAGGFPEKKLVSTTLAKWNYGLTYLESYVEETKKEDFRSVGCADELTLFWGKSYHRWLIKQNMAPESATRYVRRLIEAINYIAESGEIKQNPLANLKLSRAKTKEVYFLEPDHLERFWKLDSRGEAGKHIWWMGLIFLTGLDYSDAVRYVKNRLYFEREVEGGKVIVINRSKPPKSECWIPILPQLELLLQHIPDGTPPTNERINDYMRGVEAQIGFPHRLTCKVGRKTAGAIFFAEFGDIGAVSRMLGHGSIALSERYYVKTTGHTVTKAMRKRYIETSTTAPFRRAA